MATKSVIEIDVLDDKFRSFADAFAKYQEALKKMPGDWQKVNSAANSGSATVAKNIAQATKNQKDLNKAVGDSSFGFRNAARLTGDIAKNLASGAISIAKWVSIGAIGGGFGLGGIAASASDARRQAQGLGISTGQLRAANVNLGKYIDPTAALSNIAELQASLGQRSIITRLGGQEGQNPADMLATVMKSAVEQFKLGGQTKEYAEAMGLTQVFSMEELRRLSSLTEKEFKETIEKFNQDRQALAIDDAASRAWQDFWVQLKRSGNVIETSFIKNLVTLTPQLTQLSESVAKAIDGFLGSEEVKQKLDELAKYIGSEEFKQAAGDFMQGLKDLASAIAWVISTIPNIPRGLKIMGDKIRGVSPEQAANVTAVDGTASNKIAATLMKLGVKNPEAIAGFMGGTYGESGFNPSAHNYEGGGHYGLFQLGKTRQKEAEDAFGKKYWGADTDYQIANFERELLTTERATLQRLIAAKSKAEGVGASLDFYRPFTKETTQAEKDAEFNRRLTHAGAIRVEVSSTAGSDITANAKGLPQR
ncbi:MAG: phage tail tip lysozyme [Zwartia sp.]